MGPRRPDLTGQKFGRLTVVGFSHVDIKRFAHWQVVCDCGVLHTVRGFSLTSGHTQSCGCRQREDIVARNTRHGRARTSEYRTWLAMKQRCSNPRDKEYSHYGGRGITVCDQWKISFDSFLTDMGKRPPGAWLDRIDNNRGYSPDNCRWVTPKESSRNFSRNVCITWNNTTRCLAEWADVLGFNYQTIYNRLFAYGWPIEKAFTTPVHSKPSSLANSTRPDLSRSHCPRLPE
jgi:hypothetical protein